MPAFVPLRRATLALTAVLGLQLAGCVYVPRTVPVYDENCKVEARHMTLEPKVMQGMANCSNEGCAGLLVASGLVTAASVVISGSIVVVGNAVYWFEKRGQCEASAAAASGASSGR